MHIFIYKGRDINYKKKKNKSKAPPITKDTDIAQKFPNLS